MDSSSTHITEYNCINTMIQVYIHRRTSNYLIASGEKTSVYTGTVGSRRSVLGPNRFLKEPLTFHRHDLSSLVFFSLSGSANFEIKIQIVAIQNRRNSVITGPTVYILMDR